LISKGNPFVISDCLSYFSLSEQTMNADLNQLLSIATQLRRDVVRQVYHCQSGHPGGSLGCADYFTALYFSVMHHKPSFGMEGKGEDVFYLSNGHISPIWYAALARSGYFPVEELATFRNINGRLQGHPTTHEGLPGVRVASGSLGQGLSVALGHALAKKVDKDPGLVYALTGDGELQEGQIWEALMFGAHHKVDNIVVAIDRNFQQIDGPTEEVLSIGDLQSKLSAFGWRVLEVDGNDMASLLETLNLAKSLTGKGQPIALLMNTIMGKGVDFMENDHGWHGVAPNQEQLERALAQLEETLGDFPAPNND
jgi:transketolase